MTNSVPKIGGSVSICPFSRFFVAKIILGVFCFFKEEPKQEEKKEEPKQEEKKEETKEEDKKSELMLLKDMLVYQEGEDKGNEQIPGN